MPHKPDTEDNHIGSQTDSRSGQKSIEHDYFIHIAVVGDSGSGKSSLIKRAVNNDFSDEYVTTYEKEFKIKTMDVHKKIVKLKMCDSSSKERFFHPSANYNMPFQLGIIVFDLTNRVSFNYVKIHIEKLHEYTRKDLPVMLLANKSDLVQKRIITQEEILELLGSDSSIKGFAEVSARSGAGIQQSLITMVEELTGLSSKWLSLGFDNKQSKTLDINPDLVNLLRAHKHMLDPNLSNKGKGLWGNLPKDLIWVIIGDLLGMKLTQEDTKEIENIDQRLSYPWKEKLPLKKTFQSYLSSWNIKLYKETIESFIESGIEPARTIEALKENVNTFYQTFNGAEHTTATQKAFGYLSSNKGNNERNSNIPDEQQKLLPKWQQQRKSFDQKGSFFGVVHKAQHKFSPDNRSLKDSKGKTYTPPTPKG